MTGTMFVKKAPIYRPMSLLDEIYEVSTGVNLVVGIGHTAGQLSMSIKRRRQVCIARSECPTEYFVCGGASRKSGDPH